MTEAIDCYHDALGLTMDPKIHTEINHAICNLLSQNKSGDFRSKAQVIQSTSLIYSSFDITYDNEILNHPELLKLTAQKFGFSKALKLCSGLSNDLVLEAIL